MAFDLTNLLVIGISSRALFDLSMENKIYEEQGLEAYCQYQLEHENDILQPGTGFLLIQAMLRINELSDHKKRVEVVIISRNSADTSLRIFNSIEHYQLDITRAAFTGGDPVAKYLNAFEVDLFLSATENDVQDAAKAQIASGMIYDIPKSNEQQSSLDQIRIAFDGDAVLFSEESERIYQNKGLEAFIAHENKNAQNPLPEGPFAKFLKTLSFMQFDINDSHQSAPIRTALVTARNSPAHERVIRTLRTWNVRIDETFFLGGVAKDKVLTSFAPHIFFDDQHSHCDPASKLVPTARVPMKGDQSD